MRAIVFDGKLQLNSSHPMPVPRDDEALVRVTRAGVCATDIEITRGYMGFTGVPGHEFTGVVEECVDDRFEGRRVTGEINIACGARGCEWCASGRTNHCPKRKVLGILGKDGAFAEYLTLPLKNLHPLPDSVTDDQGVFIEPLAAAMRIAAQVDITQETSVCVLGDGRLGLLVAMALSISGCSLLAIGRHQEKLSILTPLGIETRTSIKGFGREFDVVVDCTGRRGGLQDALRLVKPLGTVVLKTTLAEREAAALNQIVIDEITVVGSRCGPFRPAIEALENGSIEVAPLVSRVFALGDGVEAVEYASSPGVLKVLIKP